MRILLYKGESQYGALRLHIDKIAKEFEKLGHQVVIIDFKDPNFNIVLSRELSIGCDFTFCFNCIFAYKKIYDQISATYITALVDHPIYHMANEYNPNINIT